MTHTSNITVQTTVMADNAKTWDYWTCPEHIRGWNFASDDWHCPYAANDLRPGGKISSRMEAKDGSFGFDFEAVYDEIIEGKKIAYTIADGRKVITDFEDHSRSTTITTAFEAEDQNPEEMQQAGWQAILDNFKKYVETH